MDEKMELKVAAMEAVLDGLMADAHAQRLVLRAVIATHPHPQSAKAAFQVLCGASEYSFSDSAFSAGMSTDQAQSLGAALRRAVDEWTAVFPPQAPGRDMP